MDKAGDETGMSQVSRQAKATGEGGGTAERELRRAAARARLKEALAALARARRARHDGRPDRESGDG